VILSSPQLGYHFTFFIAFKASFLNPSTDANHCGVALNMIGFLHLQQCGYECAIGTSFKRYPFSLNHSVIVLI